MHDHSLSATGTGREKGAVRVLLVDAAARPVSPALDGPGFDVATAPDLAAATASLGAVSPDVVVVDADVAIAAPADLRRFRARLGSTAVLLRSSDPGDAIAPLVEDLDGTACLLPAEASAAVVEQLVRLAAERARLTEALARRVGELERRTAQLEQSRARFRDVIERNADAIVVVGRDGVIRFANPMAAELFRSGREALIGTAFGFPVSAGETTELDLLDRDEPRVVEMRVVESEWEGRAAYIASLRDITERTRAEQDARRLIRAQAARTAAEAAARRFRFLAEAGTLLSAPLDYARTLSTLAHLCTTRLADWAVVYLLDDRGAVCRLEVAHRDPARADAVRAIREYPIAPDGPHPVLEVLRTREPQLVERVDDARLAAIAQDERHLELLRQLGLASFILVPLVARDRGLGAIGLASADPERPFTDQDLAEATDLALRAALALDNARLYEAAQAANQAKSDLLAVISHDLRTPLNSIMGHASLLTLGIPDQLSDESLDRVERIRTGTTHLVYLIDELLSFARLDAGREEVRLEAVDAGTVAREVAAVVEPLALERDLAFHLDLPDHELELRTDPDRLRQVLLNLVGNAIKYTERGEVVLELRSSRDGARVFQVRDTGIGIPPEHLGRIFEPFWQADAGPRTPDRGTGLGLSVVGRLVCLLGGEVTVESVVGSGSTFTVRLPPAPPS